MSQTNPTRRAEPSPADPDAVRADIDRTRAELADTVDQLAEKVNVKAQASQKMNAAAGRIWQTAAQAKASAPPRVQLVLDRAGEKWAPMAQQMSQRAAPHRGKILAGVLAAFAVLILVRHRRDVDE
jgi:hypothetical protein